MDLRAKDVAELLQISESTLKNWLKAGKIPSYRLNAKEVRFSRMEIENWMIQNNRSREEFLGNQGKTAGSKPGIQHFSLYRSLHRGDVFVDVEGNTKEKLICNATTAFADTLNVDAKILAELLLGREELAPTALGHGIAIPHTREFLQKGPFDLIFVVYPKEGIEYRALDRKPVHVLFFLFATTDKSHLHLLAKIAYLSNGEFFRAFLQKKPSKKALLDFVRDWESKI